MSEKRNSNLLGKITILVMVGVCVNAALALDGSGTEQDPWRIESLEDFNDFAADANYWAGFTRLETDVNLAGIVYERAVVSPDVNDDEFLFQGTKFTGVFDGNDHKILNLTIDDGGANNDFLGLFGCIGEEGQVSNMGIEDGSVSGNSFVGGLVGKNEGNVSNCFSKGDVNGFFRTIGGLVGLNTGNVSNCYSTSCVTVQFTVGVGGLVGGNTGTITNSYSTGNVTGQGDDVGGIGNNIGTISNCYFSGSVSGDENVGGLVGLNWGSVADCYSTGSVCGDEIVGGLMGWNLYGDVSNCYSTGDVNGTNHVGGSVGANIDGSVSNCLWDTDTQTHGVNESIGNNSGTATNVTGLPTAQMQIRSTFTDADWDFINVWNIGENQTYPHLRVYLPSDINKDGIVNFLDIAITANQWLQGEENE